MPEERRAIKYPLIVFDWDGTLFDSAAVITDCIQLAARDMALPVRRPHAQAGLGMRVEVADGDAGHGELLCNQ